MIDNQSGCPACPICGENEVRCSVQSLDMDFDGVSVSYQSQFSLCGDCGSEFVTLEQSRLNKRAVIEAKSRHLGIPSRQALREWRKRWGLTQKGAGELLGVGPVAFSKYENAALLPSAPTARLLDAVTKSDFIVRQLANKHNVTIRFERDLTSEPVSVSANNKALSCFVTLFYGGAWAEDAAADKTTFYGEVFKPMWNCSSVSTGEKFAQPNVYRRWAPSVSPEINIGISRYGEESVS